MKRHKTISLLGAGYLGLHFAKSLKKKSYHLKLSTTQESKRQLLQKKGFSSFVYTLGDDDQEAFLSSDYLFILTPPSESALAGLKKLNVNNFSQTKIIYTSSIGVYASELKSFPQNFSIEVATKRQKLLLDLEKTVAKFPQHMIIRLGGLIGEKRHPAHSIALQKKVQAGETPINLTHLDDVLNLFQHILQDFQPGVYHFVSEGHPLKKDFYTKECLRLGLTCPIFEASGNPERIIQSNKIKEVYGLKLPTRFTMDS